MTQGQVEGPTYSGQRLLEGSLQKLRPEGCKRDCCLTAYKEQSRNIPETEVTCAEAQSNKALITFKNETSRPVFNYSGKVSAMR